MRVESKCLMFGDRGVLSVGEVFLSEWENVRRKVYEWQNKKEMENNEIKRQTQSGFVMKFLFIIMNTRSVFG
jgi:hypothetical protein